jgi:hypothetical protein
MDCVVFGSFCRDGESTHHDIEPCMYVLEVYALLVPCRCVQVWPGAWKATVTAYVRTSAGTCACVGSNVWFQQAAFGNLAALGGWQLLQGSLFAGAAAHTAWSRLARCSRPAVCALLLVLGCTGLCYFCSSFRRLRCVWECAARAADNGFS